MALRDPSTTARLERVGMPALSERGRIVCAEKHTV